MNGIHDMGGMDGFGKVEPEANEPVFHAAWEARVLALNRAMGASGVWNIDLSRYSRETLAPDVYLASSYYRKWYLGLEQMLLERALVDADEIATGHSLSPGQAPAAQIDGRRHRARADTRIVWAACAGAGALWARRSCAGEKHQPADPHPIAALRARPRRDRRTRARLPCLSRHGRGGAGGASAMALYRLL